LGCPRVPNSHNLNIFLHKVIPFLIRLQGCMSNTSQHEAEITDHIQQYEAELAAFIRSRVGRNEDADDLLQEVWYQLSKALQQTAIKNVRAWVYRVARNKIIDLYRKQSPEGLEDLFFDEEEEESYAMESLMISDESPEVTYVQDQFWEALYEALDGLPEKQRQVFIQNELEGMTMREIAENEGVGLKTIISRKTYAIRVLRQQLGWLLGEYD